VAVISTRGGGHLYQRWQSSLPEVAVISTRGGGHPYRRQRIVWQFSGIPENTANYGMPVPLFPPNPEPLLVQGEAGSRLREAEYWQPWSAVMNPAQRDSNSRTILGCNSPAHKLCAGSNSRTIAFVRDSKCLIGNTPVCRQAGLT